MNKINMRINSLLYLVILLLLTFQLQAQDRNEFYDLLEEYIDSEEYDKISALEPDLDEYVLVLDTLSVDILIKYGETSLILGEFDSSVSYFERALGICEQLEPMETLLYSDVLYNLTTVYLENGQLQQAKETVEKLLAVDGKLHGKKSSAYLESTLYYGEILMELGDYDQALKVLERQLKLAEGDFNKAVLQAKIGDIYSITGNYEASTESISEASGVFAQMSDTLNFELAQAALGLNYINQGKYPLAEQIFLQAAENLDRIPGTTYYVDDVSSNLALAQMALGRSNDAIALYEELLKRDSASYGIVHPNYITSITNLGAAYGLVGLHDDAIETLKNGIALCQQVYGANSELEAVIINNIAYAYDGKNRLDSALLLYNKAKDIFEATEGKSSANYATVVFNIGKTQLKQSSPKAEKTLLQALKLREKALGKNHPKYAEVTNYLAIYYWQQNELEKARQYFEETFINFFEQIRLFFPALSEEEKTKFYLENLRPAFEQYNALAEVLFEKDPSVLGTLYDYQLKTKGIIMAATERLRRNIYNGNDSTLIKDFETWKMTKERLSKLYSNNDPRQNLIDSLNQYANKLERSLVSRSSDFAKIYDEQTPTWKDIQKQLKDDEAAVEIIRYRVANPNEAGAFTNAIHYLALIIDNKSQMPRGVLLTRGKLMEGRYLNNYRNSIRYQISDQFTYKELWEPLRNEFKNFRKVYISPDGVYNQVNMSTLVNPETGEFLIKELEIQEVTSTRDLMVKRKNSGKSSSNVLIGFPTYTVKDGTEKDKATRSLRGGTRGMRGAGDGFSETRGLRGGLLRYMRSGEGISTLPGTKVEVEEISEILAAQGVEVENKLLTDANESAIKQVESPKVLHVATHGYFLADVKSPDFGDSKQYYQNPLLRAGLILAGAEDFLLTGSNTVDEEDGILTAYEAMNMDLVNTDLVVLSACETGLGEVSNGEGVYGLQRAFKIAGAKSIIMSMWNVDDDATQRLMTLFYEHLAKGKEKYYAFRDAQIQLMDEYKEPFYWGAFKIVGE